MKLRLLSSALAALTLVIGVGDAFAAPADGMLEALLSKTKPVQMSRPIKKNEARQVVRKVTSEQSKMLHRQPMKKAAGEEFTEIIEISALNVQDSLVLSGKMIECNDFIVAFEKGSATSDPVYYEANYAIKLVAGNEMTVLGKDPKVQITSVEFGFDGSSKWTSTPKFTNGSYSLGSQTWSGATNGFSVVSNGTADLQYMIVKYNIIEEAGGDVARYIGNGTYNDIIIEGGFSWEVPTYKFDDSETYYVPSPYGQENSPTYFMFDPRTEEYTKWSTDLYIQIFEPNFAVLNIFFSGLTDDEGNQYNLLSKASYEFLFGENSGETPSDPSCYGILEEDGIITFPQGTLYILVFNEQGEGSVYEYPEDFRIYAMPGVNIKHESENYDSLYVLGQGDNLGNSMADALVVGKSDNGDFEFDLYGAESLAISSDVSSEEAFFANLYAPNGIYGSNMGQDVDLWHTSGLVWTPWKGDYHVVVAGDLSKINITAMSPRPEMVDIYFRGTVNAWGVPAEYKFEYEGDGVYTLTLPEDIDSEWKVASEDWRYDFSYNGAINPDGVYFLSYQGYNSTLPLRKDDKLTLKIDEDVYTNDALLTVESAAIADDPWYDQTQSEEFTDGDITYTTYPSERIFIVSDGKGASGDVALKATYEVEGHELTLGGIASGAFEDNGAIKSIEIPEGLRYIGANAFKNCEFLRTIDLPATVETIGDYAFFACDYITDIQLSDSIKSLGMGAFENCSALRSFNFNGAKLSEIAASTFAGCSRLAEVSIPSTVDTIGLGAFANSGIKKLGRTSAIKTIGDRAFENTPLAEFTFGDNLKSIGIAAFAGTRITSALLPASVEKLGNEAFKGCELLTEVAIPAEINAIGESTFEGCASLHSVEIPANILSIGERAFFDAGLVSVNIPNEVKTVGESAFSGKSLVSATIGTGIISMSNLPVATDGMIRLLSSDPPLLSKNKLGCNPALILVPQGSGDTYRNDPRWMDYEQVIVEENGQTAVVDVSVPGKLGSEVKKQTGLYPAQVTDIKVTGELNESDFKALRSNFTLCYNVDLSGIDNKDIPANAFSGKTILNKVLLPVGLEAIGENAFEGCSLMTLEEIPATLKSIGDKAFYGCSAMEQDLVFGADLEEIGESAFENAHSIKSLDLSASSLETLSVSAFAGCVNLKKVVLGDNVTEISDKAFKSSGVADVTLPTAMRTIGASVFEGCASLGNIDLPESLEEIGERAFAASGIAYVNIPEKVSSIEDETFADCHNLIVVNLPAAIEYLGSSALASPSISAVSSPAESPAATGLKPFDGVNNYKCGLSIPGVAAEDYLNAEYWGSFVDVRENVEVTVDDNVEVTFIDESDYQVIASGISKGAPAISEKRAMALGVMKANEMVAADFGYGKLFNGATLYRDTKSQTRYFFNVKDEEKDYQVFYNDEDVTAQVDKATNSWLAPAFLSSSTLKVVTDLSGVNSIKGINSSANEIFTFDGVKISSDLKNLAPGIYIVKNGEKTEKMMVK